MKRSFDDETYSFEENAPYSTILSFEIEREEIIEVGIHHTCDWFRGTLTTQIPTPPCGAHAAFKISTGYFGCYACPAHVGTVHNEWFGNEEQAIISSCFPTMLNN
jgi:hypothetical protein